MLEGRLDDRRVAVHGLTQAYGTLTGRACETNFNVLFSLRLSASLALD